MPSTEYFKRFMKNIDRVNMLCSLYDQNKQALGKGATDILRASVVFLHASQEDYYRSIVIERLPAIGTKETLNRIALADTAGRTVKFPLGALLSFTNMTVEELLKQSVRQYLAKTSFNTYSDIYNWMKDIQVDLSGYNKQTLIENLIKRRHRIVHEVDMVSGDRKSTSAIDMRTVRSWKEAVVDLIFIIDDQIIESIVEESDDSID